LAILVGLLFVALAIPGSPLTNWLARLLGDRVSSKEPTAPRGAVDPVPAAPDLQLRAAVGAMISPRGTLLSYRDFFDLLARRLDRELVFVQRRTYAEMNDMLVQGEVDVAWVCTGALKDLHRRDGALLGAVPAIDGSTSYHSYLIVPDDSDARTLADLRGEVFAYTDELSLTGRRVVVRWLERRRLTDQRFFQSVFYTHAHDKSIQAVKRRLAGGACVDSLIYDFLAARSPEKVAGTKIAWRSEAFPIPPLVVSARVDPEFREEIIAALLALGSDPEAKPLLQAIGVDSLTTGDPELYFAP
jgi:phosphonate transport system substrate-binding protein